LSHALYTAASGRVSRVVVGLRERPPLGRTTTEQFGLERPRVSPSPYPHKTASRSAGQLSGIAPGPRASWAGTGATARGRRG
jgi:hypothetical protein